MKKQVVLRVHTFLAVSGKYCFSRRGVSFVSGDKGVEAVRAGAAISDHNRFLKLFIIQITRYKAQYFCAVCCLCWLSRFTSDSPISRPRSRRYHCDVYDAIPPALIWRESFPAC